VYRYAGACYSAARRFCGPGSGTLAIAQVVFRTSTPSQSAADEPRGDRPPVKPAVLPVNLRETSYGTA
jgi:hypothetical protein